MFKKVIFVLAFVVAGCSEPKPTSKPVVVVCDSLEAEPVIDPRDPYLRAVVRGCTLHDVNGPEVEVRFID